MGDFADGWVRRPVYDVRPDGAEWEVSSGSSKRSFRTKSRAVKAERRSARVDSARVRIHSSRGVHGN